MLPSFGAAQTALEAAEALHAGGHVSADVAQLVRLYRSAGERGDALTARRAAERLATLSDNGEARAAAVALFLKAGREFRGAETLKIVDQIQDAGLTDPAHRGDVAGLLRRAAETGDAPTQLVVARRFGQGQGVLRNQVTAQHWLRTAAQTGTSSVVLEIVREFTRGVTVPEDKQEAERLLGTVKARRRAPRCSDRPPARDRRWRGQGCGGGDRSLPRPRRAAQPRRGGPSCRVARSRRRRWAGREGRRALCLAVAKLRKEMPAAAFETWSKATPGFRRAMLEHMKAAGAYAGNVETAFGPAVKRALETYAKAP